MCGRFTLILDPVAIQAELGLGDLPADIQPRYNIAPGQDIPVVTDPAERRVDLLRWGLIPSWAKDASIGSRLINARSETLAEKPSFRAALTRRRCLVLADGFYEWYHPTGRVSAKAQPVYFSLTDHKPFAFAGLWDTWRSPEGELVRSATIITCPANECVNPFHERMPVMLDAAHLWDWTDPSANLAAVQSLLQPYPADQMVYQAVSTRINNPDNEGPECLQPPSAGSGIANQISF